MKVRNGFVSNSSSTSFSIYGFCYEIEDLYKAIYRNRANLPENIKDKLKGHLKSESKFREYLFEDSSILDDLFNVDNFFHQYTYEGECGFFGREWNTIEDDETGLQFKESTEKKIEECLHVIGLFKDNFEIEDHTCVIEN